MYSQINAYNLFEHLDSLDYKNHDVPFYPSPSHFTPVLFYPDLPY